MGCFPHLIKSDDYRYDFIGKDNKKVELKTDFHDMNEHPNFFMEKYSNENKDLGGPFRALDNGIDFYLYLFHPNRTLFIFKDIRALVDKLNEMNRPLISIKNDTHTTLGMVVDRAKLKGLYQCIKLK